MTNSPERGREEDGHQPAYVHPGVDANQVLGLGVLNEQAVPGRLVYLLKAVEQGRGQKQPEVVGYGPHQAGHRPAEEVPQHGGEFSPQLVRQDAPKEGEKHLDKHGDGEDEANLHVGDALGVHVQGGKRRD